MLALRMTACLLVAPAYCNVEIDGESQRYEPASVTAREAAAAAGWPENKSAPR